MNLSRHSTENSACADWRGQRFDRYKRPRCIRATTGARQQDMKDVMITSLGWANVGSTLLEYTTKTVVLFGLDFFRNTIRTMTTGTVRRRLEWREHLIPGGNRAFISAAHGPCAAPSGGVWIAIRIRAHPTPDHRVMPQVSLWFFSAGD